LIKETNKKKRQTDSILSLDLTFKFGSKLLLRMSAVNAELIEAAKKGDAAKITECLKNGADIEFVDEVSPLPLYLSVSSAGSLNV
jgi:hypothetical protein